MTNIIHADVPTAQGRPVAHAIRMSADPLTLIDKMQSLSGLADNDDCATRR
jgi:hypothetical protein